MTILWSASGSRDEVAAANEMATALSSCLQDPERIRTLPVESVIELPAEVTALRRRHPQLFADILRSRISPALGNRLLWCDADMLFVQDVGELFDTPTAGLAAAGDRLAWSGSGLGLKVCRAFDEWLASEGRGGIPERPINCGLLLITRDLSQVFAAALAAALSFLDVEFERLRAAGETEQWRLLRRIIGQLAWNHVFRAIDGRQLTDEYNRPTQRIGQDIRELHDAKVLHYVGDRKEARMIVDFARIFGV